MAEVLVHVRNVFALSASVCLGLALGQPALGQPALAATTGGAAAPAWVPDNRAPRHPAPGTGGVRYHAPDRARPKLTKLGVSRSRLFAFGRPVRISFAIRDRSSRVRVWLEFIREGDRKPVYRARLGRVRTGVTQTFRWRGTEGGTSLRQGDYRVRVIARDPAGNRLLRGQSSSRAIRISFATHRFPVAGAHGFGGAGARFGAPRPGRTHQGQDVVAAEGVPIVAPRAGRISWRGNQAGGAGYYLVLDADGENFDYAFMHLREGSFRVAKGSHVMTGQALGEVGQTGDATGPHLHFEIWRGAWYAGGTAIDPLPALRAWDRWS